MNSYFRLFLGLIIFVLLSSAAYARTQTILVYGDSLSAAYGMNIENGWVSLLGRQLAKEVCPDLKIHNASISGETSGGGATRLAATLDEFQPQTVLLELGANDGLRGYPIKLISEKLENMIDQIEQHGAQTVLLGVSLPPSYGPRYVDQFKDMFVTIADKRKIPFINLYNEAFYIKQGYMQRDGLHPTEKAQPLIKDTMIKFLLNHELF